MQENDIYKVNQIYKATLKRLDTVLVGQENVKKIVSAALLCDANSKMLFVGNTGMGKTTLAKFLASSFDSHRLSITSDMIPSDIENSLKSKPNMDLLQIDEFNRASGKVQSALIELLAEKQMTIDGKTYFFSDFYVVATQNNADIAGIFNVPQAVYDRFDISVYFDQLEDDEKQQLLFSDFVPTLQSDFNLADFEFVRKALTCFKPDDKDIELMMRIFNLIDETEYKDQSLFAGSNIRAHMFAIKLAKLTALINGRSYILSSDIADYISSLYKHRIDQNLTDMNDQNTLEIFENLHDNVLSLKRKRF